MTSGTQKGQVFKCINIINPLVKSLKQLLKQHLCCQHKATKTCKFAYRFLVYRIKILVINMHIFTYLINVIVSINMQINASAKPVSTTITVYDNKSLSASHADLCFGYICKWFF